MASNEHSGTLGITKPLRTRNKLANKLQKKQIHPSAQTKGARIDPVWHLFVVRHPRRDELQRHLAEADVGTLIHYPVPPHLSGAYSDLGQRQGAYPIAEGQSRTGTKLADRTAFEPGSAKSCNRGSPFFPLKP